MLQKSAAKGIINRVGLFNPSFFAYYEDTDLSWRIRLHGYSIVDIPDAMITHIGMATSSKASKYLISFEASKNRLYTLALNYSLRNLFKYGVWVILSYFLDMLTHVLLYNIRGDRRYLEVALGRITGISYVIINIRRIWKERMVVQYLFRKVKDEDIVGRYILVPKPFLPSIFIVILRSLGLIRYLATNG